MVMVMIAVAIHPVLEVLDARLVSALEAMAIGFTIAMRNRRMPKFIAIANIWRTVIAVIPARSLHAIVESSPRNLVQFLGRRIPSALLHIADGERRAACSVQRLCGRKKQTSASQRGCRINSISSFHTFLQC